MKFHRLPTNLLLILCCSMVLASCKSDLPEITAESTIAPSATVTPTKTMAPTRTNVPTETLVPTFDLNQTGSLVLKSDQRVLFNVTNTGVDPGLCYPQGSTEIWQAKYPFTEKQVLIAANPEKNYFSPTYSPDGQWIAYIESNPTFTSINFNNPSLPDPMGNESIWIMRTDGSDKQRVSKLFDSYSIYDFHKFCYQQSYMYPELKWSPDGKYIYFRDHQITLTDYSEDYYILDVQKNESFLINKSQSKNYDGLVWLGTSGEFFYSSDNKYWTNQINSTGVDQGKAKLLPLYSEFSNSYFVSQRSYSKPIIFTRADSRYISTIVLWRYEPTNNSWVKTVQYKGSSPRLGTSWGEYFDKDNDMVFIDLVNNKIIGAFHYKDKISDIYVDFPELTDESGNRIVSLMEYDTNNIWIIDPNQRKAMTPIITWKTLDPEKRYSQVEYSPYSWSP